MAVKTDISNQSVTITFDDAKTDVEQIKAVLNADGYAVTSEIYLYPSCRGGLDDVIAVLQVMVNLRPENINDVSDLDGDNKIGWTEAICIMQRISGIRN